MFDPHSQRDTRDSIHIARDPRNSQIRGFEITLGTEEVSVFMPFSSIEGQMPAEDQRLLKSNAEGFLRKYGRVMISTARDRLRQGELGSPDDLERFEANETMRRDAEELSPEQAAILASLRDVRGGAPA